MMSGKMFKATLSGLLAFLLLAVLSGCSTEKAVVRDYSVSRYDVEAILSDDGSVVVTETMEFSVQKSRRKFSFIIPYAKAGNAALLQVAISSGSDAEREQYVVVQLMSSAISNNASSYEIKDDGSNLHIEVSALSEAGSRRKIRLIYSLASVVVLNADNAVLKRDFFSTALTEKVGQAAISIQLPTDAADVELWYLPVSSTNYVDSRPQEDLIIFSGLPATGEQTLTLYCLLPKSMFVRATAAPESQSWDQLTAEARQAALTLSGAETAKTAVYHLVFVLLAVSVILVLIIFWLYDRECAVTFRHRYWQTLPDNCPPAVLAVLLHRDRPGRLMLATLLDLVRRGELRLQGNVFSLPSADKREYIGFDAFEIFLVQWLFDNIAHDSMISTAEIRRYARDVAAIGEMHEYYCQFRRLIDEAIEQRALLDHWRLKRGRIVAGLTSLLNLLLSVGTLLFLNDPISLLLLIPAVFLAVYAWKIRRLTSSGRDLYALGSALRRTIRDLGGEGESINEHFFRDMLPLSIALDNSDRLIDHLIKAGQDRADPFSDFKLDIYGILTSSRPWQDQVAALGGNIRIMTAMLAASLLLSAE